MRKYVLLTFNPNQLTTSSILITLVWRDGWRAIFVKSRVALTLCFLMILPCRQCQSLWLRLLMGFLVGDFFAKCCMTGPAHCSLNWEGNVWICHDVQGQRLLQLAVSAPVGDGTGAYTVSSTAPPTSQVAPAGYYMLFAVADGSVGYANWVKIG